MVHIIFILLCDSLFISFRFLYSSIFYVFSNAETQTKTVWPLSHDEQSTESTPHGPQTRTYEPISPGNKLSILRRIRSFTSSENWHDIAV